MFTMRDGPETPARTRATLKAYLLTWRARGFGVWAICDRDSGDFLGECGFWQRGDSLGAALRFAVVPAAQGRGLAREAALAAVFVPATRGAAFDAGAQPSFYAPHDVREICRLPRAVNDGRLKRLGQPVRCDDVFFAPTIRHTP